MSAQDVIETGESKSFFIKTELTEEQISQLVAYSNSDPEVIKFTSDPRRFKDRNAFNEWLKKERKFFALTDFHGNLAGIIWYGEQELPQNNLLGGIDPSSYNYTFAIRLYGKARGKRLSGQFMQKTFERLFKIHGTDIKGMWLETSADNLPAVRSYSSFGYRQASKPNAEGKIYMVRDVV